MKRRKVSEGKRAQVFAMTAGACYYCGFAAEDVEHIIPYAYSADNGIGNLVPSCSICNSIAGSQVFASLQAKKDYILGQRNSLHWKRKIGRMVRTIITPAFDLPKQETPKPELRPEWHAKPKPKGESPRRVPRSRNRITTITTQLVDNSIFKDIRQKALPGIHRGQMLMYGYVLLKNRDKCLKLAKEYGTDDCWGYVIKTKMLDMTEENAEFGAQVVAAMAAKRRNRKAKRDLVKQANA